MAKQRIRIPEDIAACVLVASDNTCCKCEERGAPIQIHHIDENPANNDPSNLAVLCLTCHNATQVGGGFGRGLSGASVRLYRDQWETRVADRRREADALFVQRSAGPPKAGSQRATERRGPAPESVLTAELESYIDTLPDVLADAYTHWQKDRESVTSTDMLRATYGVTEVVGRMWLRLANAFPDGHFDGHSTEQYLDEYVKHRYSWLRALAEPEGIGTGGTIVGLLLARGVLRDLEAMVVDTRHALKGLAESPQKYDDWMAKWNSAIAGPGWPT